MKEREIITKEIIRKLRDLSTAVSEIREYLISHRGTLDSHTREFKRQSDRLQSTRIKLNGIEMTAESCERRIKQLENAFFRLTVSTILTTLVAVAALAIAVLRR